jgi:hypothetical protein
MTFAQILNSEYKWLVEAIEHGSTDEQVLSNLKSLLFEKTGYKWVD